MDFRQTNSTPSRPATTAAASPVNSPKKETNNSSDSKWLRILNIILLFAVAVLVVCVALVFTRTGNDNEHKFVDTDKYQAVFLNNGQVYFGHIGELNGKYVQLSNIYYLTQGTATDGSTTANSNYTLVKLGCQQIHNPYDQMIINRDQVTFWENLQDSGKVVTSIKDFIKANPKGPDCSQVSSQTQASSTGTAAQGTGTGTSSTGTTGTGTTKTGQ